MGVDTLVALCRAGFETETAADLGHAARHAGFALALSAERGAGFVTATAQAADPRAWRSALDTHPAVFARNPTLGLPAIRLLADGSPARPDRLTPLLAAIDRLASIRGHAPPWRSVWVEYPDTNEGKALSPLAKALQARLDGALAASSRLDPQASLRLHIMLPEGKHAYVGTSAAERTRWPLGIPRLARSRLAPSRSSQKLAEAFVVFLGDREREQVRAGQRAVDLGAAPGGWTWLLAQRGLRVTAVDNGSLEGEVARDPLVTHVRADGLRYRPSRRVDWLTCDIVDQPIRIAELVSGWIAEGAARHAIFNLKLPMKQRYDELRRCAALIEQRLHANGVRAHPSFRQLYHDREEVTGYLTRDRYSPIRPSFA